MERKAEHDPPLTYPSLEPKVAQPRVGVRELRQNLSVYLERVMAGERFDVTDRGNVVAMLVPRPRAATLLEQLVAAGRATAPRRRPRQASPVAAEPVAMSVAERQRVWEAYDATRDDR